MSKLYQKMTVREMCDMMGLTIPADKQALANTVITRTSIVLSRVQPGDAYMILSSNFNVKSTLNAAIRRGAAVIFVERRAFQRARLDARKYPVIFMEEWVDSLGKLFGTIRKSYPAMSVAITGSMGKTTTKQLVALVAESHYKTYASRANQNSFTATATHIMQQMDTDLDVFIHECGGGSPFSVEKAAAMMQPDIFILTTVKKHHMNTYKSFDNIFYDKTSFDRHMPTNGVIITNYDEEAIANHQFRHRVISFGIETAREVAYRAVNIVEDKGKLDFDIVSYDEKVHMSVNIIGRHNVYNIMAAFIAGKEMGIPTEKIVDALGAYKSVQFRQNYLNVGGYHLYVDCYNVAFASIIAGLESLKAFEPDAGCRRLAIIGGENKLGAPAAEASYAFSQKIRDILPDYTYVYGRPGRTQEDLDLYGDGQSIYRGLTDSGFDRCEYVDAQDALIQRMKTDVKRGDVVLFKGIVFLDMPLVIDLVFGTSIAANYHYYKRGAENITVDGLKYIKSAYIKHLEINGFDSAADELVIPDEVDGCPVYRVHSNAFGNQRDLKSVTIGKNVINIGAGAFSGCSSLTELTVPGTMMVIESDAFAGCVSLERVVMEEGMRHIGANAFSGCQELKEVVLPASIGNIEEDAFQGCRNVVICCPEGSFAAEYAQKNELQVKYI